MDVFFSDGFESGVIDLSRWNPQVYDVVDGATLVTASAGDPVRSGQYALRIQLTDTDLDPNGKARCELRPRLDPGELDYRADFGVPHVYEFSIYLPADWEPDVPEIVAQWHGRPDVDALGNATEPFRSPPVALRMTYLDPSPGSGIYVPAWDIVAHWDDAETSSAEPNSVRLVSVMEPSDASGDLGRWVDWRFEVTWDWEPGGEGSLRVLKDGVEVAHYLGPNAFNDAEGPNSKIGLYKWAWPTGVDLRVAYYDDIRVFSGVVGLPALGRAGSAIVLVALIGLALGILFRKKRKARGGRASG